MMMAVGVPEYFGLGSGGSDEEFMLFTLFLIIYIFFIKELNINFYI